MLLSGLIIAVSAALLLFVGAIASGPAAVIGIVGIGLIGASAPLRRRP